MITDRTHAPAELPTTELAPARSRRWSWPGTREWSERSRTDLDRLFGRYAVICACATVAMFAAVLVAAPARERPGLLLIDGLAGTTVMLAIWFLRQGLSSRLLLIAGVVLMALGIVAGATLTDGLDGAAVMPLAGALLVIPILRGRRLLAMFVLAFGASMVGEVAAYVVGGMTHLAGLVSAPMSLAESGVMLAFTYGLVWWVSNEWRTTSARSAHALTSQRQLLALNERLLATLDPEKVLNLIADSLKSVVAYDNLTIYRIDRDAGLLRPVLARDRFAAFILENTFPIDRGITGWVVTHGEPQCVNDALHDPRMSLIPGTPAEEESMIVVPLLIDGQVGGTLNVGRMGGVGAHFQPSEFEVAQLFAKQASIALQNADAHHAVSTRAETDALTGLRNRGAFERDIAALLADQSGQPLTLLMLDLDGFKTFNDRHGHPAGDSLLGAVARALNAGVRACDRAYRYGGDEFAVLLPGAAPGVGVEVAGRITAAIARLDLAAGVAITASVGVACQPDDAATRDGLVAAADAALYQAKESGCGRVAVAGISGAPSTSAACSSRDDVSSGAEVDASGSLAAVSRH
ncbi:MAG: sensor domain-containing diguanylate cyclase [Candidatus Limnocylindrales bacterium]|jgi:diguanylate cyclase (GGDEF)-like protein